MTYKFGINWDRAYADALSKYPDMNFNIPPREYGSIYPGYYESTQCRIVSYLFDNKLLSPSDYATPYLYYAKNNKCLPEAYFYCFLSSCDIDLLNKIILTGEMTSQYLLEALGMPIETLRDCLGEVTLERFVELRNVVTPPISPNILAEVYTALWTFISDRDPNETQVIRDSVADTVSLPRQVPLYVRTFTALVHEGFIKDSHAKHNYHNILLSYSIPDL